MTATLPRAGFGAAPSTLVALCWVAWVATFPAGAAAGVCVTDDEDRAVCLDEPAGRIVALSPGATELLFAAGAGDRVVGTVTFSDYPRAAKDLPRVGSHDRVDLEALLALEPDLIVGWSSGNPTAQLERLERLGPTIYYMEPRRLDDVARTLERLGRLAGTGPQADRAAADYRAGITAIGERYAGADPVRVFYQIWDEPLMTVNDVHVISEAAALCGGDNVFGHLGRLVPRIDREVVLEADPEAIVVGGMGETDDSWLEDWKRYGSLTAVRRDNLFLVPPSTLQRPTPRLLDGVRLLCECLETARERR